MRRELTCKELAEFLSEHGRRKRRGGDVIDLAQFWPCVDVDSSGQEWLVYRRR